MIPGEIWGTRTVLVLPLLLFNFSFKLLMQWSFRNKKSDIMSSLQPYQMSIGQNIIIFKGNLPLPSSLLISSSSFPTFFSHMQVIKSIIFHSLCLIYPTLSAWGTLLSMWPGKFMWGTFKLQTLPSFCLCSVFQNCYFAIFYLLCST